MLDLVIKGGEVIDATGLGRWRADVGIRGGRITAVGKVTEAARRTIDATGCVVAPGFVDPHTHYDAQLFWDPAATPSCFHGVTTVLAGNCGFSLAPLAEGDAGYLQRLMARVEGMPLAALEAGLGWDWCRLGEYLDRVEGRLGVNAGFLVGHSALRRFVMGEAATEAEASPDELERMRVLLAECLVEGGLGLSSSHSTAHSDGDGRPVPSRASNRFELLALATVLREHPGTTLEFITSGCMDHLSDEEMALMADMSVAADRPLNWNVLTPDPRAPEVAAHQLSASDMARERGGRVVALTMPGTGGLRVSFRDYSVLHLLPGWTEVLDLPVEERIARLRDPATRAKLARGAREAEEGSLRIATRFASFRVGQTFAEANRAQEGRLVGDIAVERGAEPLDVLCDIVVADELRTHLWPETTPDGPEIWRVRAALLRDGRTLLGGSDAGAHLDRMCGARYPTHLLGAGVREFGALTLEEAVRMLSHEPAELFGLRDRGRIGVGWFADLVVFDPATVAAGPIHEVTDLPGGCARLVSDAAGVHHVVVNGRELVRDGALTGDLPGILLRSGQDTETVVAHL